MNKYATTPQGQYHGPLPVRNFFPLPNIIFDLGLTAEEIAVYAFLMKCEDRRTYENRIYLHIIPSIGKIPLNKLTQSDLQKFYADLKKNGRKAKVELYGTGLSDRMVRSCHTTCRTALQKAV